MVVCCGCCLLLCGAVVEAVVACSCVWSFGVVVCRCLLLCCVSCLSSLLALVVCCCLYVVLGWSMSGARVVY